jgi:MFS superfamily sulfate permease-like transporter
MSAMRFVHQVAEAVCVRRDDEPGGGVRLTVIGPLFFGVTQKLADALAAAPTAPVLIDLSQSPVIDASAATLLADLAGRCRASGRSLQLCGVHSGVERILAGQGVLDGFERRGEARLGSDWRLAPAG